LPNERWCLSRYRSGWTGCWLKRSLRHRGQARSSPAAWLAKMNGDASALSLAGLPMHAVPAVAALVCRRDFGWPAADRAARPRRHAADRGTRQDQPHSVQVRSYSAAGQNSLIATR
jgi:hypothetical protein